MYVYYFIPHLFDCIILVNFLVKYAAFVFVICLAEKNIYEDNPFDNKIIYLFPQWSTIVD